MTAVRNPQSCTLHLQDVHQFFPLNQPFVSDFEQTAGTWLTDLRCARATQQWRMPAACRSPSPTDLRSRRCVINSSPACLCHQELRVVVMPPPRTSLP